MPIIHENPTYFSDKPAAALSLNRGTSLPSVQRQQQPRCETFGARRKHSVTSYEDTEDGNEMETFLSSCESNNSYNGSERGPSSALSNNNHHSNRSYNFNTANKTAGGSLKRNISKNNSSPISPVNRHPSEHNAQLKGSGISSLTRLGQLFKKSKSKLSVGSDSHASTVESSGIGSPTRTPDSSLSIYTNSLDGDSHSSSNSNQISPKHLEESMEDKFCSTYTFDDCGIFAANMYYNVGESSVFTIYHQHNNGHANGGNNTSGKPQASTSRGSTGKGATYSVGAVSDRDDEFEDCVQPYYNNTTFSTFPNPKRCSVASAASTTTSSFVPVPLPLDNENRTQSPSFTGKPTTNTGIETHPIQQDGDGYLRPNEPCNLRNVKNLYINDSVIANANRNGQVQQVQVDVHTPTSGSLPNAINLNGNFLPFSGANTSGGGGFSSSAASSSANSGSKYHFDSAGSTTSAATTLVAGGSNNFFFGLPENENIDETNKATSHNRNGPLPVYMNRAYFGSNSILPTTNNSASSRILHQPQQQLRQKISPASVAADCEPYCSLCASSIMGSPRQRSKMDVAIVKCKECFFSREAESHIRGFFDKLMTEDKQKMDVTLKSYDLKDLDHPTDRVVVHSAKVQIVIISHHFLQRLKDEASRRPRLSPINRVVRSKNVIAVLLAVTSQEVLNGYESVLPRFREWFSVDLRSTNKYDQEFCKKFTEQVVRIYNVELSNSSNFSVFPKKVTREQPKIAIVFKKPIEQNDEVRVELKTGKQVNVISNVKLENPHTTLLRIPESLSPDREAIVDVSVFVNNNKIGGSRIKSELNMRRMDDDDVDRMTKLLPPFAEWLDKHIAETLLKHYKECTDYTVDPELELMNGIIICKADSLPTIMHFAAYYGLWKTAFTVLEEADGLQHCSIRNELDEIPADIAFARGHNEIGQLIGEYQEISNSYAAYQYIKDMVKDTSQGKSEKAAVEDDSNCGKPEITNSYMAYQYIKDMVKDTSQGESEINAVEDDSNCEKQQELHKDLHPVEDQPENESETKDRLSQEGPSVTPTETPTDTQRPSSDLGSSTKSEDEEGAESPEEKKVPTPTTRRAKTAKVQHRRQYVNVDGNPDDNPEVVQPREKKISNATSDYPRKRFSIFDDNYKMPRPRDQDYEIPPAEARPVSHLNDNTTSNPVFKPKKTGPIETASGYLIMNDGVGVLDEITSDNVSVPVTMPQKPDKPERKKSPQPMPPNTEAGAPATKEDLRDLINSRPGQSRNNNDTAPLDTADEQLIQLMNDFKNKTYDLKVVELLFENWKQRPDVQKSIETKMEKLDKLREEYRKIQQQLNKGTKKPSVIDKIKTSLTMKRKKSNVQAPSNLSSLPQHKELQDTSTNNGGLLSPTALTFTGPSLPTQNVNHVISTSPSQSPNIAEQSRVSESSYRTSIDSRFSDSSVDSDKTTSETSNSSNSKSPAPLPQEYPNPMNKRNIASYVLPNPIHHTTLESGRNGAPPMASPTTGTFDTSYQVPPPPRPVKPSKKLHEDEQKTSPNISRKPPAIPTESRVPSSTSALPPVVPAKPVPKYLGAEPTSPPPVPPPRTNNAPNMFSYIDYKKKVPETNEVISETGKKSYENMSG